MGEHWQQKHTQHAPSTKMECDYLYGWIEKGSHMTKFHQNWWTLESAEEEEEHLIT